MLRKNLYDACILPHLGAVLDKERKASLCVCWCCALLEVNMKAVYSTVILSLCGERERENGKGLSSFESLLSFCLHAYHDSIYTFVLNFSKRFVSLSWNLSPSITYVESNVLF